jgi:hypothetical protein
MSETPGQRAPVYSAHAIRKQSYLINFYKKNLEMTFETHMLEAKHDQGKESLECQPRSMKVMEDATKTWTYLKPGVGRQAEPVRSEAPVTEREPAPAPVEIRTIGQKTLERWFLEERGGKQRPKRLNIPNQALVTSGGPIRLTGNITLIDEDGRVSYSNELNLSPARR